jgi:hypothetical protein
MLSDPGRAFRTGHFIYYKHLCYQWLQTYCRKQSHGVY